MLALSKIREAIPKVKDVVDRRISEFERLGREGKTLFDFRPFVEISYEATVFSELCFCILTANSSAIMGIKIQAALGEEGFKNPPVETLTQKIQSFGHRFAHQRAERIALVRERWEEIEKIVFETRDGREVRRLLAEPGSPYKIKGFGYKEASHFLRNVGFHDVAIIDRHIYRFLIENSLIKERKTITPKVYLEAEDKLQKLCEELGLRQSELDLYIFYIKTKKVLK